MSQLYFSHIESLLLLWVLPFLILLFLYEQNKRRKALTTFISPDIIARVPVSASPVNRFIKSLALFLAIICIIISIARPAWDVKETTISHSGRDVVFILDVSRSMLADDLKPNRLERAKLAIADCINQLQGDRVALVAFAGDAVIKCPLTLDYGFFLQALDSTDTGSVSRGGTMIGDAIRIVLNRIFDSQQKQFRDIVLITDGEDHESFPLVTAETAGDEGVRLLIVGLGNEKEGRRIPLLNKTGQTSFIKYQGQEVWSRLDATTLRQMAKATPGGKYLPVATGSIDLGEVYLDLIASADKKKFETETIQRYEEKFQIFLALAIVLLVMEGLIGEKQPRKPLKNTKRKKLFLSSVCALQVPNQLFITKKKISIVIMRLLFLFICVVLFIPSLTFAGSISSLLDAGNTAYELGEYEESLQKYQKALAKDDISYPALFNKGNSLYKLGRYDEALTAYEKTLNSTGEPVATAGIKFNMGNTLFQQATKTEKLSDKLDLLKESSRAFQQALQYDNSLQGAGRNLEICRRTIKEIEEQQRRRQEQMQQAIEQQQNLQKQLENLHKKQQELADSNSSQNRQEEIRQDTEELTNQLQDNQSSMGKQDSQAINQLHQAIAEQKKAEEHLKRNKPQEAQEQQNKAANSLQQAIDSLQKQHTQQQTDPQQDRKENNDTEQNTQPSTLADQQGNQEHTADKENIDLEPSEQALEEILNAERKLQKMRKDQRAQDRLRVDKDW